MRKYEYQEDLTVKLQEIGYIPNITSVLYDVNEEEKGLPRGFSGRSWW